MMKLKHLFDNRGLTEMILANWDYNKERTDLLNFFRISANAVYPFEMNGFRCFLRFAPEDETSEGKIMGELEFLRYLRNNGYPAVATIFSKEGNELETVDTPWGRYYAVVFKGVPGKRLKPSTLSDELIFKWGKSLGELHKLSSKYTSFRYQRNTWREQLQWMSKALDEFPHEIAAREEIHLLEQFFSALPVEKENYGLIHYDFETDNVFYDENTGMFHPIDFDDAVYHWFMMDIEQSLDSMNEEMPVERREGATGKFIQGYGEVMPLKEAMFSLRPIFRRYADLNGYIRILRSLREKWRNEPEWMVNLRKHLKEMMAIRSCRFGQPVN